MGRGAHAGREAHTGRTRLRTQGCLLDEATEMNHSSARARWRSCGAVVWTKTRDGMLVLFSQQVPCCDGFFAEVCGISLRFCFFLCGGIL